ncbi:MAG TPA: efflux RND transporter periplasmic adaptor subunit [Bacteroidota bacterium]
MSRSLFGSVALVCSLLLSSCGARNGDPPPRSASRAGTIAVSGVVLRPQPLDNVVRSSGTVLASESVDLVAEAAGRIDRIFFAEGRHVRKDELLVKINDDDLQAQLRKTELQIQLASDQAGRQDHLYQINGISKEQRDVAFNQVNTLKADRDNLVAAIRKRELRAPFDGVIGLRAVSEGGYVSQTTRIASIQKINPVKVDFSIPGKYAGQVAVGDPVQFSDDEAQIQGTGALYAIEPKIDPATGALQLRAVCENKNGHLFPGAFVQVTLRLRQTPDALVVPTQAVIPVLKGQTVLVRKNGLVVSVPVKTGTRTPTGVQILEGLAPGDTVLTSGLMQARSGMPVNVAVE